MSENVLQFIALNKLDLSPQNLAFSRKYDTFDCAVVLDEPGNGKLDKAQLAIFDVFCRKQKPNILIVAPEKLMYSWYRGLIGGIGLDFKFITAVAKGISFFSPLLSNLYITSSKALKSKKKNETLEQIEQSGIVWDLVIIDGGLSTKGIDPETYIQNIRNKTEKLVVFAPYIAAEKNISDIPAALLSDSAKFGGAKGAADKNAVEFSLDTPFMKYYKEDDYSQHEPDVCVVEYELEKEFSKTQSEQVKKPLYRQGGNIFEELNVEERKLYINKNFDGDILGRLCGVDKKLEAYLNKLESILSGDGNVAVTYFCNEKTLQYVEKALMSKYPNFDKIVSVQKSNIYDINRTLGLFGSTNIGSDVRVVLAFDDLDEKLEFPQVVTHVINYEIPDSPALLQQRYKRGGSNGFKNPQFVLFSDKDRCFDGRLLYSVLMFNICDCFSEIPSRSVFFFIDGFGKAMADVFADLSNKNSMPSQIAAEIKYNLSPDQYISVGAKLDKIRKAFGIVGTDKKQIAEAVENKIIALRKGFCYTDVKCGLQTVSINPKENSAYSSFSVSAAVDKRADGLAKAKKMLDERIGRSEKWVYISDALTDVNSEIRNGVLFNVWRYWKETAEITLPYREFVNQLNEGVI